MTTADRTHAKDPYNAAAIALAERLHDARKAAARAAAGRGSVAALR